MLLRSLLLCLVSLSSVYGAGDGPMILSSLPEFDQVRADAPTNGSGVRRPDGSNLDILTHQGKETAICQVQGILPFTDGKDLIPRRSAFEDTVSMALALHHLNTGDGSVVPQLEGIHERCPIRFTMKMADTQFSEGVALQHVVDSIQSDITKGETKPCAFLGAYRSAVSIPTSLVTGLFDYPQISGASTSADLDDGSQFPLFGRTVPSDDGTAVPIILYLREVLNVRHLAVINVNDAYGNAYVEGLRHAVTKYAPDMEIRQIAYDDDGEQATINAAVDTLVQTGFRYVFALIFTDETHDRIMTEAYKRGAAGTGEHNWFFADSFLGTLDREFEKDSILAKCYRGVGLLEVSGGVPGLPSYDGWLKQIHRLKKSKVDMEYLANSKFPDYDDPAYDKDQLIKDDSFLLEPNGYSPFHYEAAVAIGLAACNAVAQNMTLGGHEHFDTIRTTEFDAVSGRVVLSNATGTRDPTSALYRAVNYVPEDVGNGMVKFKPVLTDLFQGGEWKELKPFLFNDGTANVQADLPPKEDGGSTNLGLVVGVPIAATFFVAAVLYICYERKRKQNDSVWHVNREDLHFAEPPEILGRGTFGLVLLAEYRGTQVAVKKVLPPNKKSKRSRKNSGGSSGHCSNSGSDDEDKTSGTKSTVGTKSRVGFQSGMQSTFANSSWAAMTMSRVGVKNNQAPRRKQNDAATRKRLKQEFIEEMRYLSKLRHPCITTVMGAVIDKKEDPMLVMEYMDHGSLYDILHNETMVLEGEILLPILRDVSQGMRFLHSADPSVIHGDLKAANILVDSRFRAKVADFGLSQKKNMGGTGTPFWMAPELLRGESTNTKQTDVYAFGIMLYEVYSRRDPYEGEDPEEVLKLVANGATRKRPPLPARAPIQVQTLMKDCIEEDAEKRPSFEELDVRLKRVDADGVDPNQSKRSPTVSLFDIFPRHIAEALRDGRTVEAEHKECVTIFFSDIVGFTSISSSLDPRKVASMLDRLYTKFDALSNKYEVFKVETIGDAYMCVTNLVRDQSSDHVKRIAQFAMEAITAANETCIDEDDPSKGYVNIRVGFHSGPVVADVVGTRNPRYCLFGDTVNTSSRMESNSKVNRIHCSKASADLLKEQCPEIPIIYRGKVSVKGKGEMKTFWVNETEEDPQTTLKSLDRKLLGEPSFRPTESVLTEESESSDSSPSNLEHQTNTLHLVGMAKDDAQQTTPQEIDKTATNPDLEAQNTGAHESRHSVEEDVEASKQALNETKDLYSQFHFT